MKKSIFVLASLLILVSGCHMSKGPRLRGYSFGGIVGDYFLNHEKLGKHGYKSGLLERNGFVYTCQGGFIDMGHLRESADRTAYFARITKRNIIKKETEFSFQAIEPSRFFVKIEFPENWEELSEKEKEEIGAEISIRLGQHFASMTTIWHEIITWFGYTSTGIFSEEVSSFSWEDTYSDLFGINIAALALRDTEQEYDDIMTKLIEEELGKLGAQPAKIARRANRKIYGKWYTGAVYFFTRVKKRNFDTGLDDNFITPLLVPGICRGAEPKLCPAPDLSFLTRHGFSFELEIEPRIAEKKKILKIVYPDGNGERIKPAVHFPILIEQVKKEAIEKYGPKVDVAELP